VPYHKNSTLNANIYPTFTQHLPKSPPTFTQQLAEVWVYVKAGPSIPNHPQGRIRKSFSSWSFNVLISVATRNFGWEKIASKDVFCDFPGHRYGFYHIKHHLKRSKTM
jgi:hypothetical protein